MRALHHPTPVPFEALVRAEWGAEPWVVDGAENLLETDEAERPLLASDHRARIIWDPIRRSVVARPARFGARPFYFAPGDGAVLLATSALRLLRALGDDQGQLNPIGILDQMCGEAGSSPATVFRKVLRLPAGKELRVGPAKGQWSLADIPHEDEAVPCLPADVCEVLPAAVRRLLDPAGTVVPLSGGLDSSLLLALAVASGTPVRAASLDDGHEPKELETACELARSLGVEHERVAVSASDVVDRFPGAVLASESLLWNARATAKFVFYERVSRGPGGRMLSGVGADELFWGNPSGWESRGDRESAIAARWRGDRAWVRRLCAGADPTDAQSSLPFDPKSRAATRRFLLRCTLRWSTLPPECIAPARLGIDVRLPYLDDEVVRSGLGYGWNELVAGAQGKLPLRSMARRWLPAQVVDAVKTPVLSTADSPHSDRRRRWGAEYERWLRVPGFQDASGCDSRIADAWLARFATAPADAPELPRLDRLLMRLSSLSVLFHAAGQQR